MKWSQVEEMAWWLAKFIYLVSFQGSQKKTQKRGEAIYLNIAVSLLFTQIHTHAYMDTQEDVRKLLLLLFLIMPLNFIFYANVFKFLFLNVESNFLKYPIPRF